MHSSEHLSAFMSGLEFALLAFEGRVHAAGLGADARAEVEDFLADYRRVLAEYAAGRASDNTLRVLLASAPDLN